MSLYNKKYTWKGWQFGVLKLACVALGVLLGVYFVDFWRSIFAVVWIVLVVFMVWALAMGVKSMRKK